MDFLAIILQLSLIQSTVETFLKIFFLLKASKNCQNLKTHRGMPRLPLPFRRACIQKVISKMILQERSQDTQVKSQFMGGNTDLFSCKIKHRAKTNYGQWSITIMNFLHFINLIYGFRVQAVYVIGWNSYTIYLMLSIQQYVVLLCFEEQDSINKALFLEQGLLSKPWYHTAIVIFLYLETEFYSNQRKYERINAKSKMK